MSGECIHGGDPKVCISCEMLKSRPSKLICGDGHPIDAAHVEAFKEASRVKAPGALSITPYPGIIRMTTGVSVSTEKWNRMQDWLLYLVAKSYPMSDVPNELWDLLEMKGPNRRTGAEPVTPAVSDSEHTKRNCDDQE